MTGLFLDDSARPGLGRVSTRSRNLPESSIRELFLVARQRQAIDLAVGSPSFPPTPEVLVDAAVAALRGGHNQYEDPRGEARLRQLIAASLGSPADPDEEITVTAGGTEALCVAVLTAIDPGDEVIVLEPFYENFIGAITLAGGIPRPVPLRRPNWSLDTAALASAFGPRTRAIVLNTPSNPTGRVLSREELSAVAALCDRWGVTVISDEVYSSLLFDGRTHLSVADLPELRHRSIVIGSFSKDLAISGWRIGYLRADPAFTRPLRKVHEVTTNGAAAPLQQALGSSDLIAGGWWRPAAQLARCRDLALGVLHGMGLEARPAEGGCFLLADITPVTDDDCWSYTQRLLERHSVLLVPGLTFFADPILGRRYVRMAFNRPVATLEAAGQRLLMA